jgi:hypothetical protein
MEKIWARRKLTQLQLGDFQQRWKKHVRKKTASSTNDTGKTGHPYVEDWDQTPISHLVFSHVQNSKWIKDLSVRSETTVAKHRETLEDIGIDKDFLNRALIAQEIRVRIDKWDGIKLITSSQQRKQLPEWRDNLQNKKISLVAIHQTKD